ncbi:MAG: MBL fold metallo-hydrolase [Egibacteraceae bacterium]
MTVWGHGGTPPATSGLRLVVLGSAGTYASRERACSSYLVEADGYRLLLDCGNGSLSRLQHRCDVAHLDAVLITHLHPDHFVDLYGLYYALRFHPDGMRSVPVCAPADAQRFVAQLLPLESAELLPVCCRFQAAKAGDALEFGPLRVRLFAAAHPVETLAVRVEHPGGVIAYSADSGPSPEIIACASGADLLLCDSTWLERQRPLPEGVHMTGAEAGRTAAAAGVGRLLVTHVFPRNDPAVVAEEAASEFGGPVLVAVDLEEYVL